jgi:PKD repeat protein
MIFEREARETLTPLEMNRGDELEFKLREGRTVSFVLEDCTAQTLITNCVDTRDEQAGGGTMIEMTARVRVDGHPLLLRRYICAQESFYEPYVINGLQIWFDGVQDLFYLVKETHGPCKPALHARFAFQDATLGVCPEKLVPWTDLPVEKLDIRAAYGGDDPWMGPYKGASAHGGLDINQPRGSKLYAPMKLDDHYYYNSVAAGHVNNRWRGVRRWDNGDIWTLQVCHLIELTAPSHTPLAAGQEYATSAGTWVGEHEHSHFVFKVTSQGGEYLLDAWIIFRQIFEHAKAERGALKANIAPLAPAAVGKAVKLSSEGSRSSTGAKRYWTFGDGSGAEGAGPEHVFARPGIYPVTLTITDGDEVASCTQLITVDGEGCDRAVLALVAEDEPTFMNRASWVADVYGEVSAPQPRTMRLSACKSRAVPAKRYVEVLNAGGDRLEKPWVTLSPGSDWLAVEPEHHDGAERLAVKVDGCGLAPGRHAATVSVDCPGAANSPQVFRVELCVREDEPPSAVTVTTLDSGFFCSPFFWLAPPFYHWSQKYGDGAGGRYLINGNRPESGQFARFTPDLAAGEYEVSLAEETLFGRIASFRREGPMRFNVRVKHAGGESVVRTSPTESRVIGTFKFDEGTDGFVEILAEGSAGQVLVDAVRFVKTGVMKHRGPETQIGDVPHPV